MRVAAIGLGAAAVLVVPGQASVRAIADDMIQIGDASGIVVRLIPFGAAVTAIEVPDRDGRHANVLLGYATPAEYRASNHKNSFGATIGRYAGRIAGARFSIDRREVRLQANDGPNALHGGGPAGFDTQDWKAIRGRDPRAVTFTLDSPEGFQGFPGRLQVSVTYRLLKNDALRIDYRARSSKPTVLNLTNHAYFNLAGEGSGSIRPQRLCIKAGRYVATDARGIPTGIFPAVAGTALDLRRPTALGEGIDRREWPMTDRGYNHSWLLDKPAGALAKVAQLHDVASGRTLTIETTEPSIHVYTGGYLDGADRGPSGRMMRAFDGVALETQHLSDSPNRPRFPSTLLRPGQVFRSTTIWRFGITAN